ncbi:MULTISPECIES: sigma-70 family RNA polymerase sigma factor [Roseivirga]|uniref:RNA polymerase n=1 Tax=Roseivirga thermotolerans TaxID=1758176 RepID=A0ABQ3I2C8_9BACT|nr:MULTISPECIES: sigma-70 family RNA polymerase sigma factor [Roseivirga]MEC7755748.1 sigma-70 family RNA polymerase sigma factor [Bacteroidota bacterium]GHE51253.1 RNA polymerase [Roseivirga thermotolerans]|tara:strand:+ start:1807 stop:2334 length:528 start_codon:yes stop_codon:yes gene_type:complete
MEESELVLRLKDRDKNAMAYLYDKYSAALLGVASRIIKDDDISEEVLQDVFMKIWNKIDQYDASRGRFFTWMMNLTRNAAIDKLRSKEISRSSKTDSMDDYVYRVDSRNSTEMHTDGIGVRALLNDLVEEQKFILEKVYFEGFTHTEIAEEYDIPLGTVKSRLRSALKHMRKKLA